MIELWKFVFGLIVGGTLGTISGMLLFAKREMPKLHLDQTGSKATGPLLIRKQKEKRKPLVRDDAAAWKLEQER